MHRVLTVSTLVHRSTELSSAGEDGAMPAAWTRTSSPPSFSTAAVKARQPANGQKRSRRYGGERVPVLGELAVGEAVQVEGNQRVRTEAVVDAVDRNQVSLGDNTIRDAGFVLVVCSAPVPVERGQIHVDDEPVECLGDELLVVGGEPPPTRVPGLRRLTVENMSLRLTLLSGTSWVVSQCSAILPRWNRKMSSTAERQAPGVSTRLECTTTRSFSEMTRLMSYSALGKC